MKALKITAIVLGSLILIVLGLVWAGGLMAPNFIQGFIANKTGFAVTADKFSVNPFGGRVEVKDFKITNPASFETKGFLHIEKAVVDVDAATVTSKKIHIRELTLHMGVLELVTRKDGMTNAKLFGDAFKDEQKPNQKEAASQKAAEDTDLSIDKLSLAAKSIKHTDYTFTPAKVTTMDVNFTFDRTGIQSKAQLQQEITAAVLPVAMRAMGPAMIGELGATAFEGASKAADLTATGLKSSVGVAGAGVDAASEGAAKAADKLGKAASRLKGIFKDIK